MVRGPAAAAIRAALIVLTLLCGTLAAVLVRPVGGVRAAALLQRLLCGMLLALLGVRVTAQLRGPRGDGPGGRLLVANHVSWIDALALASIEPVCFLAKREVADWPMIGMVARLQGTVFVDRRRRRLIPSVNRAMAERLAEDRPVVLFAEGTTFDGSRRGRFHTAHLGCLRDLLARDPRRERAVAQPVAVAYSDPVAAWVGDDTLLPHIWRVLRRPPMVCHVVYGAPLAALPGHDRKALGRALASAVEDMHAPLAVCASVGQSLRYLTIGGAPAGVGRSGNRM